MHGYPSLFSYTLVFREFLKHSLIQIIWVSVYVQWVPQFLRSSFNPFCHFVLSSKCSGIRLHTLYSVQYTTIPGQIETWPFRKIIRLPKLLYTSSRLQLMSTILFITSQRCWKWTVQPTIILEINQLKFMLTNWSFVKKTVWGNSQLSETTILQFDSHLQSYTTDRLGVELVLDQTVHRTSC